MNTKENIEKQISRLKMEIESIDQTIETEHDLIEGDILDLKEDKDLLTKEVSVLNNILGLISSE